MNKAITVVVAPATCERSAALARQLAIPLVTSSESMPRDCIAYLQYCDSRLQLFPADAKQSGPISVDLVAGATAHRLRGAGELIVKAVKGRSKGALHVLDAMAGLGRDSAVLAGFGFAVTLLERDPIVAALLADGLERAAQNDDPRLKTIVSCMQLYCVDTAVYLSALPDINRPDVIYLDPMFPPSEKSALVKKEMRLFQQLLYRADQNSDAEDYSAILTKAREQARLRVVVKRPRKAAVLAGQGPDYSLEGKAVRFDVYVSAREEISL
jgi:16S rRNA (guanine1516-N2)-methyltransferase